MRGMVFFFFWKSKVERVVEHEQASRGMSKDSEIKLFGVKRCRRLKWTSMRE